MASPLDSSGLTSDRPLRLHRSRPPRAGVPDPALTSTLFGSSVLGFLLLVLLLGGGTRNHLLSDLALQLLAVPLLLLALARLMAQRPDVEHLRWLWVLLLFPTVVLLYLLPLPYALWASLPGRGALAAMLAEVGLPLAGWIPLSLDPGASWAALRAMLPALAMGLAVAQLDHAWRRRTLYLVVAVAIISVPLGVAQLLMGPHSELRPYLPTNVHDAVGLFANRNHFAALLYSALATAMMLMIADALRSDLRSDLRRVRLVLWVLAMVVLAIGLASTRSRAGIVVAGLGSLVCAVYAWRCFGRRALPAILLVGGLLLAVGVHLGFFWILERLQQFVLGDHRWQIAGPSLALAQEYAWIGVGPGAYPAAYAAHEPLSTLGARIVNHAHNDWLEWWVEIGPLLPLLALAAGWWTWRQIRALTKVDAQGAPSLLHLHACWLVLALNLVHALVDYQLRTTAMMVVLACMLACLSPGQWPRRPLPQGMRPRLRSIG